MGLEFAARSSHVDREDFYLLAVEHRVTAPGGSIDVQGLAQPGGDVVPDEVRVSLWFRDDVTRFSGQLLPHPIGGIDDDATSLGSWPPDTSP